MKSKFDIRLLGPLTIQETDKAILAACAAEEALGSRDPALVLEVAATLLGGIMYDVCGPVNDTARLTDEQVEEATICLLGHALERVKSIAREGIDLMIAHRDRKG